MATTNTVLEFVTYYVPLCDDNECKHLPILHDTDGCLHENCKCKRTQEDFVVFH